MAEPVDNGEAQANKLISEMVDDGVGNGLATERNLLDKIALLYSKGSISGADFRKAMLTYRELESQEAAENAVRPSRQKDKSETVSMVACIFSPNGKSNEKSIKVLSTAEVERDASETKAPETPAKNNSITIG